MANESTSPDIYELPLPWVKVPLSLNYRMHHMQAANLTKQIRGLSAAWGRSLPRMGRCIVELEWFVSTKTRRDEDNLAPTMKALCDGLPDAGVVPDDTPQFMVKLTPRVTYRKKSDGLACMVFRVAEIPAAFRPDSVQAVLDRINQKENE